MPAAALAGGGSRSLAAAVLPGRPGVSKNAGTPVGQGRARAAGAPPQLRGASIAPGPADRSGAGAKPVQARSGMRLPGLASGLASGIASTLHLIGVSGGHDSSSGSANAGSTVAATGNSGGGAAPDDVPHSFDPIELAAAAAAAANNGNGHLSHQYAPLGVSTPVINGHANGRSLDAVGGGSDELLVLADPSARLENNITPYSGGFGSPASPDSLATQIREIATTLRTINALRLEYLEKIAQQELEIATKDQALRAKEERIATLEAEANDMRRSLALLHSSQAATEAELQRLRAAAAAAAALPPVIAPPAAAPAAAASQAAAPAPTAVAPPPAPAAAAPAVPPPAVVADAPAAVTGPVEHTAPPAAAAPPPPPPPPPPPRVPEIVLSYRSSWDVAYMHVNVEGKGWTAVPGLRMEHLGSKEHSIKLQARSIEFVLTNGHGEWDAPSGGGVGKNYRIDSPGEYRLHYGNLQMAKAWAP